MIAKARVFQGGGNELTIALAARAASRPPADHALVRLFPKFIAADDPAWSKVITKARDGAPDALAVVGWQGEVPANPVCKEVLARTSGAGTKGGDLQRDLGDSPFGWPKDAIDGALLALLASGNIRASADGKACGRPEGAAATQIGKATFFKEDEPPTKQEQLAVRGVLTEAKVPYTPARRAPRSAGSLQHLLDLAARAGGPPPLPEPPDTTHLDGIAALAGNQQFRAVAEHARTAPPGHQDLVGGSGRAARRSGKQRGERSIGSCVTPRRSTSQRQISAPARRHPRRAGSSTTRPDPVAPLIKQLSDALRAALLDAAQASDRRRRTRQSTELEASAEWQQLDAADRDAILAAPGLAPSGACRRRRPTMSCSRRSTRPR